MLSDREFESSEQLRMRTVIAGWKLRSQFPYHICPRLTYITYPTGGYLLSLRLSGSGPGTVEFGIAAGAGA
eukprot:6069715-Pleurochrysis_carterae.AAC.1